MIIPYEALSTDALNSLISEYCLRDWGLNETANPLEEREAQVRQALKAKQLLIVYSEYEESACIKPASDLNMDS